MLLLKIKIMEHFILLFLLKLIIKLISNYLDYSGLSFLELEFKLLDRIYIYHTILKFLF
jgi:hypothetical protein